MTKKRGAGRPFRSSMSCNDTELHCVLSTYQQLKFCVGMQGVGSVFCLSLLNLPQPWKFLVRPLAVVSHLRIRFAFILNHYGYVREDAGGR